jgi:hypothetical protein
VSKSILSCFNGVSPKYRNPGQPTTTHGFPINDPMAVMLTKAERAALPVQLSLQVRVFDMYNEDDLKEYTRIRDNIANRRYAMIDRTKIQSPDGTVFKIHLEWADVEGVVPQSVKKRF